MKRVIVIGGGETFDTYVDALNFLRSIRLDFDKTDSKGWRQNLQTDLGEDFEVISISMPNKFNAKYLEWKIWFEKYSTLLTSETILVGHSLGAIFLIKYLSDNRLLQSVKATFLVSAPYSVDDYFKYAKVLKENNITLFDKRVHFLQEHFPELVEDIKKL
jgi:predicted alpha/beta hydrolase family esterase